MIKISHQTCKQFPLNLVLVIPLLFSTSAMLNAAGAPAWNGQTASQQDKVTACNNLADKKGLKGDDRKKFMQDCLNQAADLQKPSDMSTKDKVNGCKDLADKEEPQRRGPQIVS